MNELKRQLVSAQSTELNYSDATKLLLEIQKKTNYSLLRGSSQEDIKSFLNELWNFLLIAGSNANASIRLAAYQTTGSFLLKLTPYYPMLIQQTFSDVAMNSTRSDNIQSSSIIASAFAFISNFNAFPCLDAFVRKNPVFHHFSNSDAILSDHLPAIIRNLGHLGVSWLTGLLHSFLQKKDTMRNRSITLSIGAVVKHNPSVLMKELLTFLREQATIAENLDLIAYLLSSVKGCNDLDFFDVAIAAMMALKQTNDNLIEKDAAFQILGQRLGSFSVETSGLDATTLSIVLRNSENVVADKVQLNVEKYWSRPAFYLLPLPLNWLVVKESDGVFVLTAKFKTMAKMVQDERTRAGDLKQIEDSFCSYLSRAYDDKTTACFQGLSKCLPRLLQVAVAKQRLISLIAAAVFTKPISWYHRSDILRIIKSIPHSMIGADISLEGLLGVVLEGSWDKNESIRKTSRKVLGQIVVGRNFERCTAIIAERINYWDIDSLNGSLEVLTSLIRANKGASIVHLRHVVLALGEAFKYLPGDMNVITNILSFLGCFDLQFLPDGVRRLLLQDAIVLIGSNLLLFSGLEIDYESQGPGKEEIQRLVDNYWSSRSFDIMSTSSLDYTDSLAPLCAALRYVYALPCEMADPQFVIVMIKETANLFPFDSALLARKYWNHFELDEKIKLAVNATHHLEYVQDFHTAAIWCDLFLGMTGVEDLGEALQSCKSVLMHIAKWAVRNHHFDCSFWGFVLWAEGDVCIDGLFQADLMALQDYLRTLVGVNSEELMTRLTNKVLEEEGRTEVGQISLSAPALRTGRCLSEMVLRVTPEVSSSQYALRHLGHVDKELLRLYLLDKKEFFPIWKTQLTYQTHKFSTEDLQFLLRQYSESRDSSGVISVIRYAVRENVSLSLEDLVLPVKAVPLALKFVKFREPAMLQHFISKLDYCRSQPIVKLAIRGTDWKSYIRELTESEWIKKKEMVELSGYLCRVKFDLASLRDIANKILESDMNKSPKRLSTSITVLTVIVSLMVEPESSFVERVVSAITPYLDRIEEDLLTRLIYFLVPGNNSDVLSQVMSITPMGCKAKCVFWQSSVSSGKKCLPSYDYEDQTYLPSFLACGLRSMYVAITSLPDSTVNQFLKNSLKKIIDNYFLFPSIPMLPELLSPILSYILASENLSPFQSDIISICRRLIPSHQSAAFLSFSLSIPRMISLIDGSTEDMTYLCAIADSLIPDTLSFRLFTVYSMTVVQMAAKFQVKEEKHTYLMDRIANWLLGCKDNDCIDYEKMLYEWQILLYQQIGLEPLVCVIWVQMQKLSPRFFPFFVSIAKFKRMILSNASQKVRDLVIDNFKNLAITNPVKCHSLALLLEITSQSSKVALELASNDSDNETTAKIISSDPSFESLLQQL